MSVPGFACTPMTQPARSLSPERAERVWTAVREILGSGIELEDGSVTDLVKVAAQLRARIPGERLLELDSERLARARG